MTEQNELVAEGTVYLNGNGTSAGNSGTGLSAAVGYRLGFFAPYVAYDMFQSADCGDPTLSAAQQAACDGSNSRNIKAGLNFFIAKNTNHINVEFQSNHGSSAYGPSSINATSAGYVPLSLDPLATGGARRPYTNSLSNPAFWSVLLHWNVVF
jgi:hypothetical protein